MVHDMRRTVDEDMVPTPDIVSEIFVLVNCKRWAHEWVIKLSWDPESRTALQRCSCPFGACTSIIAVASITVAIVVDVCLVLFAACNTAFFTLDDESSSVESLDSEIMTGSSISVF